MSQLTGEWALLEADLRRAQGQGFVNDMMRAFEELGRAIETQAKNHIKAQDLKFIPLSERQVDRKGGGTEFFLDTHFYLDNISVKVEKKGRKIRMVVGPNNVVHQPSGQKLGDIAKWLEFGTSSGIPARPLWRRTRREVNSMPEFKDLKLKVKGAFGG